ncbi:MAG: hypothetical protein IGS38_15790 [Synechococcales cyanobacterium M58_A2018_015]|nr:hypothetical protein [Synechococcales cyanobacterium M58_A2018_015]
MKNWYKGLRQRQLCEHLGLPYKAVAQSARELGLSTHAYVQQKNGWILRDELDYPPGTQFPSDERGKIEPVV